MSYIQLDVLKVKKEQSFGLRQFLVFGSHLIKTHTNKHKKQRTPGTFETENKIKNNKKKKKQKKNIYI